MTVALDIDDVRVTLGHNEVLKGVSLSVQPGEFVTLLGASGSGKSTLLNVIAGLQKIDSGHVLFDGENVERRSPQKRNVGFVFQSYALFPHMTVGENVSFPLLAARRPAKERAAVARETLELVQLGGMADREPASLSGGQRQRVALARAIAANPRVLLLDEPMAALDKQLREHMQVEIKSIQRRVGITTIAVTHDQTEALTMSDRVAIMHDGCFVQMAAPTELYRHPATEYVAKFLGEANLVPLYDGRILPVDGEEQKTGTAVIRPEDLEVLPLDAPAMAWSFDGIVRVVSFQGDRFRIEMDTSDGRVLVCTLPSTADVSLLVPGLPARLACTDPERVHIIFPPEILAQPLAVGSAV
ncbi:MAG: ABC transporter ATP-binding protein [Herbiconiux sp.]|uniref:ABC transporter ATP-binding protein n=1 Tax=Herbiconiux sp. TaxID=1871186 RepID=UPI00121BE8F7|nr:ABC transporter ATP-binding protein [Herbiconiux sp.]TAJ48085.1 MAG: ABC transporter ATP-binding protein [Herbiconiux sp.]